MEPILKEGYVVAVDTSERDPRRLVQKMVLVRERSGDDAGVTIKWLDRSPGGYTLTPENKDVRPTVMTEDHEIVGRVIWWHGHQE